ncbi:hypothetical protein FS749_010989 [Ceratobasidium sp. UAMH 11750]|nr:hypothetical protein FS749_010989 [Ceratobasidium sp. UAMH 11750]
MMWMKGDCLFDTDVRNNFDAVIANLEALRGEESGEDTEDAAAMFWHTTRFRIADPVDVVREVVSHLDTELAKRWFEPQFKREFKEGMRKMRSESVNQLGDRQHLVFELTDLEFGERHGAKMRGSAAKELLKDDAYLTEPLKDENDQRSADERFLRSPIILRATKLILTSPSSVRTGKKRSAQAGPSHADKWHVKAIIPSILSFICTIVHFVLSGDSSFEQVSSKNNYVKMYTDTLEILRVCCRKNQALYKELIALYNKEVLPDLYPDQPADGPLGSMTSGRRAIYQRLVEQASDDEGNQQEGQGGENGGSEDGNAGQGA